MASPREYIAKLHITEGEVGDADKWASVARMRLLAMMIILLPLALSFYAWKLSSDTSEEINQTRFDTLAKESERALIHRIDSYTQSLLGGRGFFEGSQSIERDEWRAYVDAIDVQNNFPGINGIGYIADVAEQDLAGFIAEARADNYPDFKVHPEGRHPGNFVITYIEPMRINKPAVGLNIAFEAHRYQAASHAKDTGKATITKRILLVQDAQKTPGFLLLLPMYAKGMPVSSTAERREAFRGWIYAPFIGKNFMQRLTTTQGIELDMRVYDGEEVNPDALIYDSRSESSIEQEHTQRYRVQRTISVAEQQWTLVWTSRPEFEHTTTSSTPLIILLSGVIFTLLLGVFLYNTLLRQEGHDVAHGKGGIVLPVFAFILIAGLSYYLRSELQHREYAYLAAKTKAEAEDLVRSLRVPLDGKLKAIQRIAQRWEARNGTPYEEWQLDASFYIRDIPGLNVLQWVDDSYHVQWVEPMQGNENAVGLNIVFNDVRAKALKTAADKSSVTLTPPIDLVQGYKAFIVYAPLKPNGQFKGFIAAIFSIDELFKATLNHRQSSDYGISMYHNGKAFYRNFDNDNVLYRSLTSNARINVYDQEWVMEVVPRKSLVSSEFTAFPTIVFFAGLIIAALMAITVRYIFIAHARAQMTEQQKRRFEMVVEGAQDGIWDWPDVSSDPQYWSPQWKALLGYEEDEIDASAQLYAEMLHPDDRDTCASRLEYCLKNQQPFNMEYRLQSKDGSYKWFQAKAVVTVNEYTGAARMLGSISNIHDRKVAQEELEASRTFLRLIMEKNPDLIFVKDSEYRIIEANPAFLAFYPESMRDSVLGSTTVEQYSEDERELFLAQDRKAFEKGSSQIIETVTMPNGSRITLFTQKIRFTSHNGEKFILGIGRDVTEREALIEKLETAKEKAEKADRAKSDFLANMSHEIRTPMNGVLGMTELLHDTELDDEQHQYLANIDLSGKLLLSIINDVLDISKIEAEQVQLEHIPINMRDIIAETMGLNMQSATTHNVSLRMHVDEAVPLNGLGDPMRLRQVVLNLISNAIKFSRDGQVDVYLKATEQSPEKVVYRVEVQDTGIGISEDKQPMLFNKFAQVDETTTRKYGGTGLGLAICKRLVELMGGEIGVTSTLGEGSCFWFTYPSALRDADHTEEGASGTSVSTDGADSTDTPRRKRSAALTDIKQYGYTVLLVEDSEMNQLVAEGLLNKLGCTVAIANHGEEALDMLEDSAPGTYDVILMDCQMPVMDGFEATEVIRNQAWAYASIPIIAATAGALDIDHDACVKAGMDDFIKKPLTVEDLTRALDKI